MVHDRGRAVLWAALVGCGLCLLPLVVAPSISVRGGIDFDRLEDGAHALAAALLVIAVTLVQRHPRRRFALVVASAVALAGAGLAELVQAQVPGRSAALADIMLDTVGVALGAGVVVLGQRRVDPQRLRWAMAVLLAVLGVGTAALVH